MSTPGQPPRSPFTAPAWIAAASLLGLVSALIGDGVFDAVSWVVFAALVAVVLRVWVKRTR